MQKSSSRIRKNQDITCFTEKVVLILGVTIVEKKKKRRNELSLLPPFIRRSQTGKDNCRRHAIIIDAKQPQLFLILYNLLCIRVNLNDR